MDVSSIMSDWVGGGQLFLLTGDVGPDNLKKMQYHDGDEARQIPDEFKEILEIPKTLPPSHIFDLRIRLHEEAQVVNIAPYRYAHYQKNEIEKQVVDLMESGLIRLSTSPFLSSVLLVRKKDRSWRFCTDYQRLNDATIKDYFPIPTVDDMLDELHRAKFFSKLDLRAGIIRCHSDSRTHHQLSRVL